MRTSVIAKLLLLILPLLGGCQAQPGVIFPPLAGAPSWPEPPDPARIFYVGQLATSVDLKPGVSGLDALGQAIFGKEDEHAMLSPLAVCTDGGDRVFVADSNAQCVHVFNLKSRKYAAWRPGTKEPQFDQPVGVAWDGKRLLVSDSVAGAITLFSAEGKYLGQLGVGELQRPVGMVTDAGGRIFVADAKAHQVVIFAADGHLERRLGSRGTGLGQFNFPTNVAMDRAGRLYVSDSLNFRVQQFDHDLKPVRQIGHKGDTPGEFAQPKGIAVDTEGHIYALDGQFENVQIFDDQGRVLLAFGEEGNGPGRFWLPTGIFIDGKNRIWVADSYNKRIQVFDYRPQPAEAVEVKP